MFIDILIVLTKIFNGNRDIIQLIYNKKKEIEKNEVLFYYLMNGYQQGRLIPYETDISTLLTAYKDDINFFLSLFSLSKVSIHWPYQKEIELFENQRFTMKVIIGCFCLDNFIKVREVPITYNLECPNTDTELFRKPTINEKTDTINTVLKKKGVFYLDLIRLEYSYGDLDHCIILNENSEIETLLGGTCGINYTEHMIPNYIEY
tara:strand:- start:5968 stop:6582 length:615 start_codon:yes stop_codon:yes gene_type:complete